MFSNSPAMSPSLKDCISWYQKKIVVLIPSPSQQVKLESFTDVLVVQRQEENEQKIEIEAAQSFSSFPYQNLD